jgi:hypothetical protein
MSTSRANRKHHRKANSFAVSSPYEAASAWVGTRIMGGPDLYRVNRQPETGLWLVARTGDDFVCCAAAAGVFVFAPTFACGAVP